MDSGEKNGGGAQGETKGKSLQRWILGGLLFGLLAGLLANYLAGEKGSGRDALNTAVREVLQPLGGIFLRLLFMTVLPLVFSCLVLGIHELGDFRQLGKVGLKTLIITLFLSSFSVVLGLFLVNTIQPGKRVDPQVRERLLAEARGKEAEVKIPGADEKAPPRLTSIINSFIPQNPVQAAVRAFEGEILGLMVFALLFGIGLAASGSTRTGTLVTFLQGVYDVSMWLVGLALKLAPLGVAALVFSFAASMGMDIVFTLGIYVLTVLVGLALQQFVVYALVLKLLCGVSPRRFFSRIRPVMITAFSTSSSNATLPTTIQVAQSRLGIPPKIANFVLTLGSTFNQNGTALYEGVTVIFLAQFYGVPLGLEKQLLVLVMAVIAGIGTAGIPGGSLPLIVPVLASVGVPKEGIIIILGIDRLLDMCRTVLNVTGDIVAATLISKTEGGPAIPQE
jgi:DAACS family dicarboxylate/amino acid:cation (Na+ or H+) symporter